MRMIKLSMVAGVEDADPSGEDDGLAERREVTKPVALDAEQVRNFYPRREPRVGTRVLFRNGSALAVSELFDEVEAKIAAATA